MRCFEHYSLCIQHILSILGDVWCFDRFLAIMQMSSDFGLKCSSSFSSVSYYSIGYGLLTILPKISGCSYLVTSARNFEHLQSNLGRIECKWHNLVSLQAAVLHILTWFWNIMNYVAAHYHAWEVRPEDALSSSLMVFSSSIAFSTSYTVGISTVWLLSDINPVQNQFSSIQQSALSIWAKTALSFFARRWQFYKIVAYYSVPYCFAPRLSHFVVLIFLSAMHSLFSISHFTVPFIVFNQLLTSGNVIPIRYTRTLFKI